MAGCASGCKVHAAYGAQHPVDPYANEKPLFTITAENLSQYAERLTEGQKAMFARYPQTFRIPVYTGHRDFRFMRCDLRLPRRMLRCCGP